MTELPDAGFRLITILVKPGADPEVTYDGFAYWEALAAIKKAFEMVEEESELNYGISFTPGQSDDGEADS